MRAKKLSVFGVGALLALGLGGKALAQSAAERAVEAAKQYAGTEITIVWEAGLQALDPLNFSGPKWKELTGIDVTVVEVPTAEMFTKILQERSSRSTPTSTSTAIATSWRRSRRSIATIR
ncbi:MAG: transporter substrate-binding protein [Geminicoccaceae bacterium]|nr:transporter substrate-binding protein [Geminicoccaceae bacterium]